MNTKKNSKKIKKFTVKMQAKLLLVFCILLIGLVGLIGRLIYLNRTNGEKYEKRVLSQQTYNSTVIPYQRGSIVDRKGTILATSQKVYNVILDVKKVLSKEEEYLTPTITAITKSFKDITESEINEIIKSKPNSQYVKLLKGLSYDEVAVFKELTAKDSKVQGVWFEEDYVRKYPYDTLGSSILGFTISGNIGNWGLEQYYNDELNGTNGREYGYIDEELKLERTVKPAVNGNTIVSTIDANVQRIVQNHIKSFNEEYGSKNIGVIVMNPNNGEVLAMASNDEYDLNNPTDLSYAYTKKEIKSMTEDEKQDAMYQMWRNYAISDAYEPGSTFKPFTVAAALDEDIIGQDDTFYCDGHEIVGGWTIRCSKRSGHGTITLMESLMKSCNDAMMNIVAREGRDLFYKYQTFFGFGTKTGIDLPGEASGLLKEKDKIGASDLATSSFGQTFTNTMIQMAASYSSLINGGYYYEPHMVKQIVNDKGATVKNIDKVLVKETVSKDTSNFIKESMFQTVEAGTAGGAKVPGYKVGGKTGTAQKLPRGNGKYLVSFIGAVPADKPEIVIYIVIDEPQNVVQQADSSLATKLTSRILTEILPFLELYPTEEIEGEANTAVTDVPTLPSSNEETSNNGSEESGDGNNTSEEPTGNEANENQEEEDDYSAIPPENENNLANPGSNTGGATQ
jgi:stage V sporulation protein D (sporulation-specific penicillin-binding protein)